MFCGLQFRSCLETTVQLIPIEIKLALVEQKGRIHDEIPFQVFHKFSLGSKTFFGRKPQKMGNRDISR